MLVDYWPLVLGRAKLWRDGRVRNDFWRHGNRRCSESQRCAVLYKEHKKGLVTLIARFFFNSFERTVPIYCYVMRVEVLLEHSTRPFLMNTVVVMMVITDDDDVSFGTVYSFFSSIFVCGKCRDT